MILSIDASTKSGWAIFDEKGNLSKYGQLPHVKVENFNVNDDPNKQPEYPYNIVLGAEQVGLDILQLAESIRPSVIVIENTVKGRNRHTQRLLEFIHYCILTKLSSFKIVYMDPSEWRSALDLRLTKDDKKNNSLVSKGKKRGRITKKHLSVRLANEKFSLSLKQKDNDISDAILLGAAYVYKNQSMQ